MGPMHLYHLQSHRAIVMVIVAVLQIPVSLLLHTFWWNHYQREDHSIQSSHPQRCSFVAMRPFHDLRDCLRNIKDMGCDKIGAVAAGCPLANGCVKKCTDNNVTEVEPPLS